jgi:hypothetical protein
MRHNYHEDRIIAQTRRTDLVGAAAQLLVWRQVCPVCRDRVTVSAEDPVLETRTVQCKACQWTVVIGEPAWRGDPKVTLRGVVEGAQALAKQLAKGR